ncbi:alpha/beta fold hydrolase [Amycolatopsis sp. DSM 110486]|uniref:alpha/beta fold hydrolase n=1 Tax=Amycolatopsis sp. DSM 110486 TaxID=2865832 RepID=UPI001C698091|nr:alpha/beta hydrolase [Amycolatopsis sp. DSM 110486]QYN18798.1 alpha/beta hydrolase [Amycolatopsis sp. DSM 110486]
MPSTKTGPAELFYTDQGTGDPVLLVHGLACDSHDWLFQFDAFTAGHRVLAPDLRGHGRSSAPAWGYTPQEFAADLAGLLDQLGTGPVVAVGHSLGGNVVSALAVARPDLVRAVVAVDPAYGTSQATAAALANLSEQLGTYEGNEIAATAFAALEPSAQPWLRSWHGRRITGMEPRVLAEAFHRIYFGDGQFGVRPASDEFLAARSCPVLAVHGSAELADWERSLCAHPASQAVAWPGAGHWLHQERADEFTTLVLDWIAKLPD